MIGKTIDNYKILARLGQGGMGVVYKAKDIKLDRFVAIKFLNLKISNILEVIQSFKKEAKNQAKLVHPNIVMVYDFIQQENMLGIVMEYVEGETLEQLIGRKIRLDFNEAVDIFRQLLNGIGYAHSKGFIHRDIKPSNIIISVEGVAKIMDFGISKSIFEDHLDISGKNIGTLLYMSPEQIKGEKPVPQSDIYSLGITFYEMLAGQTPFEYDSEEAVINGHINEQQANILCYAPELPPEINSIFEKLLAKNPLDRYKTIDDLFKELEIIYKNYKNFLYGTDKRDDSSEKRYKIKAVVYSTLIFLFGIIAVYFVVTQTLVLWRSGKNVLLLEDKSSKDSINNSNRRQRLNIEIMKSGVNQDLNSICFVNSSVGFCCGNNGTLLKTTDAGQTWQKINLQYHFNYLDIAFTKSGNGFIVGDSSVILRSNDWGNNWNTININNNGLSTKIKFADYFTGFIIGKGGSIVKSTNGGYSWRGIFSNSRNLLYDIAFYNKYDGYIVGWDGEILRTTNLGEDWNKVKSPVQNYLRAITVIDKSGFITGGEGIILKNENINNKSDMSNWTKCESVNYNGLYDVEFTDSQKGLIVGAKGIILYSKDGGKNWLTDYLKSYTTLLKITKAYDGNVFAVGVNGTIIKIILK